MNVWVPGNDTIPVQTTKTKRAMGEIVDLDRFRKQRKRREADAERAKKAATGERRDGVKSKDSSGPPAADRVESNRAARDGTANSGGANSSGDDPNPD
jgi:hypothetical protein